MHVRVADREIRDLRRDVRRLGHVRAQKLATRRNVQEEAPHVDDRSRREAELTFSNELPPFDEDLVARMGRLLPRLEREMGDGGDRRERLTAKSE